MLDFATPEIVDPQVHQIGLDGDPAVVEPVLVLVDGTSPFGADKQVVFQVLEQPGNLRFPRLENAGLDQVQGAVSSFADPAPFVAEDARMGGYPPDTRPVVQVLHGGKSLAAEGHAADVITVGLRRRA